MKIGNKVRSLRIQHGLTQEELANRCELSKGFISMIENDLTSPSISTMQDLLEVFSLSLHEFFVMNEIEDEVTYLKEDNFIKELDEYTVEYLVSDAQAKAIEPIKITLAPGGKTDVINPHEADVFGYILKGKLNLYIGDKKYTLSQGDSFYYSKPIEDHFVENNSNKLETIFMWVSTPPIF